MSTKGKKSIMSIVKTFISRMGSSMKSISKTDISESTANLPSITRNHMAQQIEDAIDERPVLIQLEETIESTTEKLKKMEESERFLFTRISKYRTMLAEEVMRVHNGENISNEEKERLIRQNEKYQQQICDVIDVHKNILVNVELLRRKLKDLEDKKEDMLGKFEECEEFVVASARLELESPSDESMNHEEHLEMGVLKRMDYDEDRHLL